MTPESLQKVVQDSSDLSLNIKVEDIQESTDPMKFVESHKAKGGPSPTEVKRMLKVRKKWTVLSKSNLSKKKLELNEADGKLQFVVRSYSSPDNANIGKLKNPNGHVG